MAPAEGPPLTLDMSGWAEDYALLLQGQKLVCFAFSRRVYEKHAHLNKSHIGGLDVNHTLGGLRSLSNKSSLKLRRFGFKVFVIWA